MSKPIEEELSPEEKTSCIGKTFFSYITPLIKLGNHKVLEYDDLPILSKRDTSEYIYGKAANNWDQTVHDGKPSLVKTLFSTFGTEFYWAGFFKLIQDYFVLFTPILLKWQIQYLESTDTSITMGCIYTLLMFLNALLQSYSNRNSYFMLRRLGMNVKCLITTLIYNKTLKISSASRMKYKHGEITDMMEIDSERLQTMTAQLHMIWSGPNTIIIAMIILYMQVGWSAFAGLAVILLMFPISRMISNKLKKYQKLLLQEKDKRIQLSTEIITGIKTIKIQTWEDSFLDKIQEIRQKELKYLKRYAFLQTLHSSIWQSTNIVVSIVTFAVYALFGGNLTVSIAFTCISCFNIIRAPINIVPSVINNIVEANISLNRIQTFLLCPEYEHVPEGDLTEPGIKIQNASFEWPDYKEDISNKKKASKSNNTEKTPLIQVNEPSLTIEPIESKEKFQLKNITCSVTQSQLVGVTARVGEGKTSLISAILGELTLLSGSVYRFGSISYVSQIPYILNATLKDNILFGHAYDEQRYLNSLRLSALIPDIAVLPAGDQTEIGEKGINLSGGQKMRVSLARAYYLDNDIYLLDDPLSAVDSHVSKYLFENYIMELKKCGKTILFITHAIEYLQYCDDVIVLKNGSISEIGKYSDLINTENGVLHELYVAQQEAKNKSPTPQEESPVPDFDDISAITPKTSTTQLNTPKITTQQKDESRITIESSEQVPKENTQINENSNAKTTSNEDKGSLVKAEERVKGHVGLSVYKSYIKAAGGYTFFIFVLMCFILTEVLKVMSSFWLTIWGQNNGEHDNTYYITIYSFLGLGAVILYVCRYIFTYLFGLHASKILHNQTMNTVIHLPMSFFDTTPMGRIINRFSKDIYTVDKTLPGVITDVGNTFMNVISTLVVILVATPAFILLLIPISIYYFRQQRIYVKTSREVKRLDSITRSPVYAFFSETIDGIYSIRSYDSQSIFIAKNNQRLNNNQRAYFITVGANSWLSLRLELVGNFVVTGASLLAVIAKLYMDSSFAGMAAMSISYALSVTQSLNLVIRQLTEVETQIVAVERLKQYADLPVEGKYSIPENIPSDSWPSEGVIDINNIEMRYRPELEPVLHNLSLHINSKDKIGVVGRTGAGKSSILLALLRLVNIESGHIYIDNVDINTIGVGDLRKHIAVIPQEPMLFSGTIRYNLDPFNQYTDAEIWNILEITQMKSILRDHNEQLNYKVQEKGENFSVGQRQLLCLSRAILNKSRIIFLDEATSSIDIETDNKIQHIIRQEFKDSTVVTVAHRIHTILDSDKIVVLDQGKVAEYDSPTALLANPDSMFSGFVSTWQKEESKQE